MLIFKGQVSTGLGKHSHLVIPGRQTLNSAPKDWPEQFVAGSLNIKIIEYPPILQKRRWKLKALDRGLIPPTVVIPQNEIGNNSLRRKLLKPWRGTGQAWRAILEWQSRSLDVWVFRRIGSHMEDCLEIISDKILRDDLGLKDQDEVRIILQS